MLETVKETGIMPLRSVRKYDRSLTKRYQKIILERYKKRKEKKKENKFTYCFVKPDLFYFSGFAGAMALASLLEVL